MRELLIIDLTATCLLLRPRIPKSETIEMHELCMGSKDMFVSNDREVGMLPVP